MTIYKYSIYFKGDDSGDKQERYVAANDEYEADKKMERYRKISIKQGMCDFIYVPAGVEIENVIA